MDFEAGFAEVERAAGVATKSASTLLTALKQLNKAATEGELGAIHKTAERISVIMASVFQEVENAASAWPFHLDSEERYMRDSYADELLQRARSEGIEVQRLDDGYLMYPSILRIVPSERAVAIDRKRIKTIRPSRLLRQLKLSQTAKPKMGPEQFLELLYRTYRLLTGKQQGKTIPLSAVYEALTLMPGSVAGYGQSEFARDLFLLDRSGVAKTKSGVKVSLPASTGTKGAKGTFSFVSPDGEAITYYGIHFLEASE
jgi:hypothetical protein